MEIKKIVQKLKTGKLSRGIDEKHREGFWDLADDIISTYKNKIIEQKETEELQESIYYAFYEIAENCLERSFD